MDEIYESTVRFKSKNPGYKKLDGDYEDFKNQEIVLLWCLFINTILNFNKYYLQIFKFKRQNIIIITLKIIGDAPFLQSTKKKQTAIFKEL